MTQCHHSTGTASPTATHRAFSAHDSPGQSANPTFHCMRAQKHSNLKDVVLDVTDFNARVLCGGSVGEQRLEPKWGKKQKQWFI